MGNFQCYLSWMYDRFCTLDKEKSNNNGSPEKKSLILIAFSVYQKPFSIECDTISFKSCLFVPYQQHFSPKICLPRNTVNAHIYPNLKCYLYFNIYDYIYFGEKYSVSWSARSLCFRNREWNRSESKYFFFHSSFIPILPCKKIRFVFNLLLRYPVWYGMMAGKFQNSQV